MFDAIFISSRQGTSKKTGNPYYQAELIATTHDGGSKVINTFCTESAFKDSLALNAMQNCKVACGVTPAGFLTVVGFKAVD